MAEITSSIEAILKQYNFPYLEQDAISSGICKDIQIVDQNANISLEVGFPLAGIREQIINELSKKVLEKLPEIKEVKISLQMKIKTHAIQQGLVGMPQIKNIIAVGSGKGGVGKSTTAVNIALALKLEGARVGILDADIYGPNQPQMLGVAGQKPEAAEVGMQPILAHGIQSMSIGYMLPQDDTPMVWRGPMVTTALQQLLNDTQWQDLDYLIIDLPPGTGDIQLTMSQKIPVSGAVIVSTPQDIALLDARKAIRMFEKVNVPVLGIIENMSTHICSQCGHEEAIFGYGGADKIAEQYAIPFLGRLPLNIQIRKDADQGTPIVISESGGAIAQAYRDIARKLSAKLSLQSKNHMTKFPKIVIEKDG